MTHHLHIITIGNFFYFKFGLTEILNEFQVTFALYMYSILYEGNVEIIRKKIPSGTPHATRKRIQT